MKKLVVHHRYVRGSAWDASGNGNHGVTTDVVAGSGPFDGSLQFVGGTSRIDVARSSRLSDLGAFRCSVSFNLENPTPNRRYNLAEGHLTFALYLQTNLTLTATILDANGQWRGPTFGLSAASLAGWHRADCGHDGVSTGWLAFDGQVVAVRTDVPGPVRPFGPRGLTIGHWPEPVAQYAFDGHLSEAWLWTVRPDPPIDFCCLDRDALADAEAILRRKGWTLADVKAVNAKLIDLASRWRRHFPDPIGQDVDKTANALAMTMKNQRWGDFGNLTRHLIGQAEQYISPPDRNALGAELLALFGDDLLHDTELYQALFQAYLCDPRPPGKPDDHCHGDDQDDHDHRRPWGADASPPEPSLGYEPGRKPESAIKHDAEEEKGNA